MMEDYDLDDFGYLLGMDGGPSRKRQPTDRNDDFNDFAYKCIGDSKNTRLPSCHYSDLRFQNAQTIFGRRKKRTGYDYSDRYPQWDSAKWKKGHELAKAESEKDDCKWDEGSVRYYEIVLTHFHGKPTEIDHVLTGFNLSSGYSYYVYGYWHPKEKS